MNTKSHPNSFLIKSIILGILFLFVGSLLYGEARPPKPGPNYVWVSQQKAKNGVVVQGHWRRTQRKGFVWVAGHLGKGIWVSGHWKPVAQAPKGKTWVPGHVNGKGQWITGRYRFNSRKGFIWISGHRAKNGTWIKGHWRKRR